MSQADSYTSHTAVTDSNVPSAGGWGAVAVVVVVDFAPPPEPLPPPVWVDGTEAEAELAAALNS